MRKRYNNSLQSPHYRAAPIVALRQWSTEFSRYAKTMKIIFRMDQLRKSITALGYLFVSIIVPGARAENQNAMDRLMRLLQTESLAHATKADMPTDYKYSISECRLLVHSEANGKSHYLIEDEAIPLTKIEISRELDERGNYYLFMKCKAPKDCIRVKGENTGDAHDYMFSQSLLYAGRSEQSYRDVKASLEAVISVCSNGR